jgi:hypothetical protein
VLEAKEKLKK